MEWCTYTGKRWHKHPRRLPKLDVRAYTTKALVGICWVGKFLKRWKQADTSKCPRCGIEEEDMVHVWRCRHHEASSLWSESLRKLRLWLEDQQRDPVLIDSLTGYLDTWRTSNPLAVGTQDFSDPIFQQNLIGARGVMDGWLSRSWEDLQQEYYTNCCSRCTGKHWLIAVIKKLWDNCVHQISQRQLHQRVTSFYQELWHHRAKNHGMWSGTFCHCIVMW
jgi:hypothetical protein